MRTFGVVGDEIVIHWDLHFVNGLEPSAPTFDAECLSIRVRWNHYPATFRGGPKLSGEYRLNSRKTFAGLGILANAGIHVGR